MPAIAGTHAPGRGEWVEGFRGWLGDIITAVSCRGWKGHRQRQGGRGEATHPPVRGGGVDSMPISMNFQLAKDGGRDCSKYTTFHDGKGDIITE